MMTSFKELAMARFSCRKFKAEKVEDKLLNEILELSLKAPTAKNLEPVKIYVLESDEALKKLDTLTHCRYNAQTVLLFTYDTTIEWKNPLEEGVHSGVEDATIIATHVMLAAKDLGLDSCYCNYFSNSKLEKLYALPENEKSVLIMPIGYKDDTAEASVNHTKKKDYKDLIRKL